MSTGAASTSGTIGRRRAGTTARQCGSPRRRRFWNEIPLHEKEQIVAIAPEEPELSPRELAWSITDRRGYFVSESSVYRILKSYDLIPSPRYIMMAGTGYR
jgi:putative transposase